MDDDKIGKHCTDLTCRQRDYLPIKCKYCSKYYCADHYSVESHKCPEHMKTAKKVFSCPLCNKIIPANLNLTTEQNFQIHEATQCTGKYVEKKPEKCSTKRCKTKLSEINKYICKDCTRNFCLRHRMQQEHQCIATN